MMSAIKSLGLASLLCFVGFLCLWPTNVSAQSEKPAQSAQPDRDQTLRQLLTEVHELRLAVQRATVNSTRFQMLIERVRVQQAHVDSLNRELENIHSQIAEIKAAKPQMEQQIKDGEDQLDRTPDPNTHADLESRIKIVKANLARLNQEDERVRSRETALDTELQAAQGKLNELNGELDSLMVDLKGP
jgi:predicted  nucleic acid-binding Zn-ribbon protein